jgi:hypothetical protein
MQLNDILEEHSIKAISKKTNISEENLEYLVAANFDALKKVKTLGFISIIEREYHADLGKLREQALEYYGSTQEVTGITLGRPIVEEKKGRSKLLSFFVLLLLGYASWYFFTQFDKKHLSGLIPFVDEQTIESFVGEKGNDPKEKIVEDLSIVTEKISEDNTTKSSETIREDTTASTAIANVSIVPVGRLWFGVIDVETKKRDHFSISKAYELEMDSKTWLVATSSAPFSLVRLGVAKDFDDGKEHYFKIDNNGIESLSKDEYVTFGGWRQW